MIELVIYLGVLTIMTTAIVGGILQMSQVFVRSRNERKVSLAAETILKRTALEIRLASDIYCLSNDCSTPPVYVSSPTTGRILQLKSYASHADQTIPCVIPICVTKEIKWDNTAQQVFINEDISQPSGVKLLSSSDIKVTSFAFTYLLETSGAIKAVRTQLTLLTGSGRAQIQRSYYTTTVLRGSY